MSARTPIPLDEYLHTSYDPDVEYVDGRLEPRNVGYWRHNLVQSNLIFALRRKYPNFKILPEVRSQTTGTRFRLPDVSVVTHAPMTRFLTEPALVAIEILSEDDKMPKVMEKLAEYEAKRIPNIWLIDPRIQQLSIYEQGVLTAIREDRVVTTDAEIELELREIFDQ